MNRLGDYVSVSAYATSLTAVAGPFPPRALTTELARMPPISVTSKLPVTVTVATVPAPVSATPVTGQVTVVRDVSVQKKSAAVTEAGATGGLKVPVKVLAERGRVWCRDREVRSV